MNRTNLAVCFGPVIFSLNYDSRKKKLKKMMSVSPSVSSTKQLQLQQQQQLPPAPPPLLLGAPAQNAAMLNVNTTNPLSISTSEEAAMLSANTGGAYRKLSEQPIGSKMRYGDTLGAAADPNIQKRSSMFETKPLGGITGPRAIDYPGGIFENNK